MDIIAESRRAAERIRDQVRETPLEWSPALSEASGADVHLKLENFQLTGSFKLRGATHALRSLDASARGRGVVAASSGNHGAAVACAARRLECAAVVFVPQSASPSKIDAIRDHGARIRSVPGDPLEGEKAARRFAADRGMTYVSPYNDARVVAGQGTIGVEIDRQLPGLEAVFLSLGGGGLASGAGGYLKSASGVRVVACSPERSPVMHRSLEAGRILEVPVQPTLSDGTAGGLEPDSITFEMCRRAVDESRLVTEGEIRDAMRLVLGRHHMLIEGAAAVAVAGFLQTAREWADRSVAVVLCGANVEPETLRTIL